MPGPWRYGLLSIPALWPISVSSLLWVSCPFPGGRRFPLLHMQTGFASSSPPETGRGSAWALGTGRFAVSPRVA